MDVHTSTSLVILSVCNPNDTSVISYLNSPTVLSPHDHNIITQQYIRMTD